MTNKHFVWSYFHLHLYDHVVIRNVYIRCVELILCILSIYTLVQIGEANLNQSACLCYKQKLMRYI